MGPTRVSLPPLIKSLLYLFILTSLSHFHSHFGLHISCFHSSTHPGKLFLLSQFKLSFAFYFLFLSFCFGLLIFFFLFLSFIQHILSDRSISYHACVWFNLSVRVLRIEFHVVFIYMACVKIEIEEDKKGKSYLNFWHEF